MNTLDQIVKRFGLNIEQESPIDINISRNALGLLFAELGFTKGAEIGTERGIYSEVLLKANPKLTLYCVDPWKAYKEYREHTTQSKIDEIYKEAIERLKPYNCCIIRKFSDKAYQDFPDGSLDFVYIDGNHDFTHVSEDLRNWTPKVRSGGIVAGHDFATFYGRYGQYNQVKKAVLKFVEENHISPFFRINNPNERPSWMWVKK
jgi:predicted O-methyltransferase YrrM